MGATLAGADGVGKADLQSIGSQWPISQSTSPAMADWDHLETASESMTYEPRQPSHLLGTNSVMPWRRICSPAGTAHL
jgi:hypothetical protein